MDLTQDDGESFDPGERRLCPDGSCVGLLDDSGRCKVCGRRGEGAPEGADEPLAAEADAEEDAVPGDDFTGRRLCPDGSCIGLVDDSGHCKVCGRSGD